MIGVFGGRFGWVLRSCFGGGGQGVAQLEALQAIATLLAHNIRNRFYEFGTLGVIPFCPTVFCADLPKDESMLQPL